MPRPSHLGALCALVLVAAALGSCSDDDGEAADPDRSTTTIGAPTTAEVSTSTTSPSSELAVVVRGVALGWWQDGSWHRADKQRPIPIEAGAAFTVLRLTGPAATSTGGTPDVPEEFCSSAHLPLDPAPDDDGGNDWVAVHGVADPQPRPVTVLSTESREYRSAATAALAQLGIDDPDPDVIQVLRADLDGDGTDEVLVVAQRLTRTDSPLFTEPGDYSVVLLRRLVDGAVRTTVVHEDQNRSTADEPSTYLLVSRVGVVADLNGDGVMEVVTESHYYEGGHTAVHELQGDQLEQVLAEGCGV